MESGPRMDAMASYDGSKYPGSVVVAPLAAENDPATVFLLATHLFFFRTVTVSPVVPWRVLCALSDQFPSGVLWKHDVTVLQCLLHFLVTVATGLFFFYFLLIKFFKNSLNICFIY